VAISWRTIGVIARSRSDDATPWRTENNIHFRGVVVSDQSHGACLFAAIIVMLFSNVAFAATAWRPEKTIEFIVATAPGSGVDATARTMQNILQSEKLVTVPIIVVNKPGGGATVGMQYLGQHDRDGYRLLIQTSTGLLTAAAGTLPLNYFEFTPIANLISEPIITTVRAESPIQNGADFISRLKKDPGSTSVAFASAPGNAFHISAALVAKSAGVDPRKILVVVYTSSGQAVSAALGANVDTAWVTAGNVRGMVEAGKLRVIAVAAEKRLGGAFANAPTWKEQGVSSVVDLWRGVLGARNLGTAEIAYWEDVFARMVKTQAWRDSLAKNLWVDAYTTSAVALAEHKKEFEVMRGVLKEMDIAK
jgi:putative tricarboxylic transport membrane protein